jgi:hypothetical protein
MKSLNGVAATAAWGALALGGIAHAQEAVQWRVEDGGNGHWYSISSIAGDWYTVEQHARDRGGHLATLTSADEFSWIRAHLPTCGRWAGAWQDLDSPEYIEPLGGWSWVTGEPFEILPFIAIDNAGSIQHFLHHNCCCTLLDDIEAGTRFGMMEWSADCNGDGIVDYGQILDGTFADANANGVPDCCDEGVSCDPCLGDVNFDGIVNGADISVLLGFWGLNGKPVAADINQDGQVDGTDLANVLGSWGECP